MKEITKTPLLTREDAAVHLNQQGYPISAKGLAKLACNKSGPKYRIFGRNALYAPSDLEAWATDRLK